MRWIIYGIWFIIIISCTTKLDTTKSDSIGIEDRFYRFDNDASQVGEQGNYLNQIRNFQQAAKEERQRFNNIENAKKHQKQAFLAKLNQAEINIEVLANSPKLAIPTKQIMEAITRLRRQAIIQPKITSSHEQQMSSINELINEMQKIAKDLK
ncbi:MAG TPA: hypothetical protein ENK59_07005 [Thioploca sp.]|nr:hypothetical protein [Thioploca sp.]